MPFLSPQPMHPWTRRVSYTGPESRSSWVKRGSTVNPVSPHPAHNLPAANHANMDTHTYSYRRYVPLSPDRGTWSFRLRSRCVQSPPLAQRSRCPRSAQRRRNSERQRSRETHFRSEESVVVESGLILHSSQLFRMALDFLGGPCIALCHDGSPRLSFENVRRGPLQVLQLRSIVY